VKEHAHRESGYVLGEGRRGLQITTQKEEPMFARVATFEGGDVQRLQQMNEERMSSGEMNPPAGMKRAMLLQGDRRLFISFFDSREALDAAEQRFESMGDEIPEDVRGRRVGVDVYEVVFDESM
jgi:hypothetical protein